MLDTSHISVSREGTLLYGCLLVSNKYAYVGLECAGCLHEGVYAGSGLVIALSFPDHADRDTGSSWSLARFDWLPLKCKHPKGLMPVIVSRFPAHRNPVMSCMQFARLSSTANGGPPLRGPSFIRLAP